MKLLQIGCVPLYTIIMYDILFSLMFFFFIFLLNLVHYLSFDNQFVSNVFVKIRIYFFRVVFINDGYLSSCVRTLV